LLLYPLRDVLHWLWSHDRHPACEFAESQIRRSAAVEKIERVLRFSSASLNRICIQQKTDVWWRNEHQQ